MSAIGCICMRRASTPPSTTLRTELGAFHVGDDVTQLIKYNTGLGAEACPTASSTPPAPAPPFPSTATQTRANLGWADGPIASICSPTMSGPIATGRAPAFPDHPECAGQSQWRRRSGEGQPDLRPASGLPVPDRVPGRRPIGLTVINIADTDPPFYLGHRLRHLGGEPAGPGHQGGSDHDLLE